MNDDNQFSNFTQGGQSYVPADDNSQARDRAEAVIRNLKIIAEEKAETDLGEIAVPAEVGYESTDTNVDNDGGNSEYLGTLDLHSDEPQENPDYSHNQIPPTLQPPADYQTMNQNDNAGQVAIPDDSEQMNSSSREVTSSQDMYLPPSQTPGRPFIGTHEVPVSPPGPSGTSPLLGE